MRAATGLILMVLNIGSTHWCGIFIDQEKRIATAFDPLDGGNNADMKKLLETSIKSKLTSLGNRRLRTDTMFGLRQRDQSSCGVVVLLFLEMLLCDVRAGIHMDKDVLEYMRYKFLSLAVDGEDSHEFVVGSD